MTHGPFPRTDDAKGHAWGLSGSRPYRIWERFSPAYERQAQILWEAISQIPLSPALEWAGSEDGEALIGRNKCGEIVVLFHLENPDEAEWLQKTIAEKGAAYVIAATAEDFSGS